MKYLIYILFISKVIVSCENPYGKKISNNFLESSANVESKNEFENDTNTIMLSECIILNETIKYLLNVLLDEYHECKNVENGYHFTISIKNATIHESPEEKGLQISFDTENATETTLAKSLYVSRSYYKGHVSNGYGFFYYRDYLFVLQGILLEDFFTITNNKRSFPYRHEPAVFFDPPRWGFCYWNNSFYIVNKSPCGG